VLVPSFFGTACGAQLNIGKWAIALHNTRLMTKHTKHLLIYGTYKVVAIALLGGSLHGCASFFGSYGPDGQSREEFKHRVEAAFRLQNRMTSEVMVIQSDGSNRKEHEPIIQAEQVMEKNCNHLNDYVSRDIDGKVKSILLLKRVENSVLACETSAQKVEELLKMHQR
jgi:hypothetical protein